MATHSVRPKRARALPMSGMMMQFTGMLFSCRARPAPRAEADGGDTVFQPVLDDAPKLRPNLTAGRR
jgi:hypothetical protein